MNSFSSSHVEVHSAFSQSSQNRLAAADDDDLAAIIEVRADALNCVSIILVQLDFNDGRFTRLGVLDQDVGIPPVKRRLDYHKIAHVSEYVSYCLLYHSMHVRSFTFAHRRPRFSQATAGLTR